MEDSQKKVICKSMNGETTEVLASTLEFRPSVYGVVVRDGCVLLTSQWDGWDFPGGGMSLGERLEDTFERQIKEETGLTATLGRLLHAQDSFFTHPDQRHYHTIMLYYTCANVIGDISTKELTEAEKIYMREARWIPITDVADLKFYNQVDSLTLIRLAAEGRGI